MDWFTWLTVLGIVALIVGLYVFVKLQKYIKTNYRKIKSNKYFKEIKIK